MLRTLVMTLLFVLSASAAVCAQRADADTVYQRSGKGTSEILSDGGGQSFVSAYKASDFKPKGYRVQLIAESGQGSQDRAQATRSAYLARYKNEHKVYLIFDAPNFKVRVGDFQTKFEAAILWKKLQAEFPNSYVVEDDVNVIHKK